MIKFATMLTLLLTGSLSYGESDIPSHIVQPLPRELDPRLEPAFQASENIVRPLTAEEQTQRNMDLAAVDSAPLAEDSLRAIAANDTRDQTVDAQIQAFRKEQNVPVSHTQAPSVSPAEPKPDAAPAKENAKKEAKKDAKPSIITDIRFDEGMYFDVEKKVVVFMKDVSIKNPQFSLTCKGPLKLYLYYNPKKAKKKKDQKNDKAGKNTPAQSADTKSAEQAPKDKPAVKDGKTDQLNPTQPADAETDEPEVKDDSPKIAIPGGGKIDLNDLEKAAASGDVVVHYINENGTPCSATGDKMTYDAKTGEIILTGNFPTVTIGESISRSLKKDNFIRVYPNGDFYCNGPFDVNFVSKDMDLFGKDKPKKPRKP